LPPIKHSRISISFCTFHARSGCLSRLDAAHHSPVCVQAAQHLANALPSSTRQIGDIARVFTPGIFKRIHVNDPEHGYAYFSGSELFQLDPSPRGYLSRNAPKITDYVVEQDWLLMQDAGQLGGLIGQLVRVTPQVHLGVVSNHLMRFVCKERTDVAYLFAVLSSRYGYLAITRHAFGSSIPQLDPEHISQVAIPWPETKVRKELARPVVQAWDLQDQARTAEYEAIAFVESAIEEAS
jgi:type I restriction enzyme S subunit